MVRVLVVDDYPTNRKVVVELVKLCCRDCEIVGEASNGLEGVQLAAELLPDVVLMDVRMPGIDGVEATTLIKKAGLPIEVITHTGFSSKELKKRALNAGAYCHLIKPFDAVQLAAKVKAAAAVKVENYSSTG